MRSLPTVIFDFFQADTFDSNAHEDLREESKWLFFVIDFLCHEC